MDLGHSIDRTLLKRSSSRLTLLAHFFGILAVILMLVWLLHFRGGIKYDSSSAARVFNAHPFLMFCGFIFLVGEAMMAYKTVLAGHEVQKAVHAVVHMVGLVLGVVGLCAVFKYHDMQGFDDMVSLHSWIGLTTFVLFSLQWVVGVATYLAPKASTGTRVMMMPWHICCGRALMYMAICAALTGLMERATILGQDRHSESRLVNFTALSILLFGVLVDFSVALARYA